MLTRVIREKNKSIMKHYGEMLEKAVRNSQISISELAKKLKVNRRTIYYWFSRKTVNIDVLNNIGQIIQLNFRHDYYEMNKKTSSFSNPHDSDKLTDDIDFWKNKYQILLERYNDLKARKKDEHLPSH
jgi:ribosome-binding protein aMBF1 (putative translation factor)